MYGKYVKGNLIEYELRRISSSKTVLAQREGKIKLDLMRDLDIIDEDKHSEIYDKMMDVDKNSKR